MPKKLKPYRKYYRVGGITIQYEADLPIASNTFQPCLGPFEVNGPGKEMVHIQQKFVIPDIDEHKLGVKIYDKTPWQIYKSKDSFVYLNGFKGPQGRQVSFLVVFSLDYSRVVIFGSNKNNFLAGNQRALTTYPVEQILLARTLAKRQGCFFHSCGVNYKGKGILLAGRSGAGKTTIARLLKDKVEILSDERVIVRKMNGKFRAYGTWQHGDLRCGAAVDVPLKAILLLKKSGRNRLVPMKDKKEIIGSLMSILIRPFIAADCWENILGIIGDIVEHVPVYTLEFDKSGRLTHLFDKL